MTMTLQATLTLVSTGDKATSNSHFRVVKGSKPKTTSHCWTSKAVLKIREKLGVDCLHAHTSLQLNLEGPHCKVVSRRALDYLSLTIEG